MRWPTRGLSQALGRLMHTGLQRLHEEARLLQSGQKKNPSLWFVIVGIASIIWLFVRSGQKPSRLAYPCQKAAAANTAVLLGWVAGLLVATAYSRRLGPRGRFVYRVGVLAGVVMLALGGLNNLAVDEWERQFVSTAIGQGTSRVAWVQDSRAATGWSTNLNARVNATAVEQMMDLAIKRLVNETTVSGAWSKIFRNHNGGRNYASGETIAIKVNFNNAHDLSLHNPNYQVVNALIRQLVEEVGVAQNRIFVYDASRPFQAGFSAGILARFPNVNLVTQSNTSCWGGSVAGTRFACVLRDSTYLINMPLLRTHGYAKVTLSFKNHLGSVETPAVLHPNISSADPAVNPLIALNRHNTIKNKTLLVVADGIYGLKAGGPTDNPGGSKGITNPYPNSLFLSTDPVAVDSVMIDYLQNRGANWGTSEPRNYLAAAASVGLGNFETNLSYNYTKINLVKCTNGTCTGGGGVPNEAPQAANDAYTAAENTTLRVSAPGVLQNDNDPDGNPLRAKIVTPPAHGTLTLDTNGSFTYKPAPDYNGPDSFTYEAVDTHGAADNATVSLTVYAIPDAPVLTGPATQTITNDNTPAFSWQATADASSYQIQIDNGNGFISPERDVTQTGTTYTPPALADDAYSWRVRGLNSVGMPGPWSAVWRLTVDTTPPDAPRLTSPRDRTSISDTTPRLTWRSVPGTSTYRVQVATTTGLSSPIINDATLTRSNYLVPDNPSLAYGTYYWRVQATDAAGNVGPWSAINSFTVTILRAPSNGDFSTDDTPLLRWAPVSGATAYHLQVRGATTGTIVIDKEGLTAPRFTAPALPAGRYVWQVRVDTGSGFGSWTPQWTFTIATALPAAPKLDSPANGWRDASQPPALIWFPLDGGGTYRYQVQIDDSPGFRNPEQDVMLGPGVTTLAPGPLGESGRYYWRVRAIDAQDVAGRWSGSRWFALQGPARPRLSEPANRSSTGSTTPLFEWEPVTDASSYQFQISPDRRFPAAAVASTGGTSYTPPALANGTHFWRVRSVNAAGIAGPWSLTWRITIDSDGPDAPRLRVPNDAAGLTDTTPRLAWSRVRGAEEYHLQVSTSESFGSTILNQTGLTAANYTLPDGSALDHGRFFWRVRARDEHGNWGAWSDPRTFTITLHKAPADGRATTNRRPTFRWASAGSNVMYTIQIANNPDFNNPIVNGDMTPQTSFRPADPLPFGTYYWQISTDDGTTWTPAWTIIIMPGPPGRPGLMSPSNRALSNQGTHTLMWEAARNGHTYQVQLADNRRFEGALVDVLTGVGALRHTTPALADGQYFWRVRAFNEAGAPGPWSAIRVLTIDTTPPDAPAPTAPANGARVTNRRLTFRWDKVTDANRYEFQIATSTAFGEPPIDVGRRTRFQTPETLAQATYHWRVRAYDRAGNVSGWSATRSFTLVAGITALSGPLESGGTQPVIDDSLMIIEAESAAVQADGTWTMQVSDVASGGGYMLSSGDPADVLTASFSGTRLDILYVQHPSLGAFAVEVDGQVIQTVNAAGPVGQAGVWALLPDLPDGPHTLRVYPVEGAIALDGFVVSR